MKFGFAIGEFTSQSVDFPYIGELQYNTIQYNELEIW